MVSAPSSTSSPAHASRTKPNSQLSQDWSLSDIWFPDGNVILRAGTHLFRVHRGQLARHSDIFRDLFSLPQPPTREILHGSDVLDLYDAPEDISRLLRALYDGLYFSESHADDFPVIVSVLRLAIKYDIEHLRSRCLAQLQLDWPTTIHGWDLREAYATDATNHYNPRTHIAHPILVINLAREMNLGFLLAPAFYDLSRYAPSKIVDGVQSPRSPYPGSPTSSSSSEGSSRSSRSSIYDQKDNDDASEYPRRHHSLDTPLQIASSDQDQAIVVARLSPPDMFSILRGREIGQQRIGAFIEQELHMRDITVDCTNKNINNGLACRESFYFVMLNILRSIGGIACGRDADPLFTLVQAAEMLGRTDFSDGTKLCGLRMCVPCKMEFLEAVRKTREDVWANMPSWFGLR